MENLIRYKFDQKYICLDTETEGLNLLTSKPWQVAWLKAAGKKVESVHNHFLSWDDLNVSPDAARLTGFDKKQYTLKKEDPYHVYNQFWPEISDENVIIIGHNFLSFDWYILNVLRYYLGLEPDYSFGNRIIDTNSLSIAIKHNLQPKEGEDLLIWQYKLAHFTQRGVKTNMMEMLRYFGIPYDASKLHDAEYDIRKNFELFHKIVGVIDI